MKPRSTSDSRLLAWRMPDVVGQADDCQLRILASILSDRVRVRLRQEMGKTYTPAIGLLAERALSPALLFLRCRIETAPRQIERVAVRLRKRRNEINDKHRRQNTEREPPALLRLDNGRKIEGAHMKQNRHNDRPRRDLKTNHLRRRAQTAAKRILRV